MPALDADEAVGIKYCLVAILSDGPASALPSTQQEDKFFKMTKNNPSPTKELMVKELNQLTSRLANEICFPHS